MRRNLGLKRQPGSPWLSYDHTLLYLWWKHKFKIIETVQVLTHIAIMLKDFGAGRRRDIKGILCFIWGLWTSGALNIMMFSLLIPVVGRFYAKMWAWGLARCLSSPILLHFCMTNNSNLFFLLRLAPDSDLWPNTHFPKWRLRMMVPSWQLFDQREKAFFS